MTTYRQRHEAGVYDAKKQAKDLKAKATETPKKKK